MIFPRNSIIITIPVHPYLDQTEIPVIDVYLKDRSQSVDGRTVLNMQYAFDLLKWVTGYLSIEAITKVPKS